MSLRASTHASVLVFARAPQPGAVKTRLAPMLGADGAAKLHARMVERALRTATCIAAAVELHCVPHARHLFFRRMRGRFDISLRSQADGDLGVRMFFALRTALRRRCHVLLIGCDCPELQPVDLRAALRALQSGSDAVFAPAEDGGYALIGVSRISSRLFENVDWGGPQVMAQTRARLRALGWRWKELRTVWDVDRPEDVARLRESGLLARKKRR